MSLYNYIHYWLLELYTHDQVPLPRRELYNCTFWSGVITSPLVVALALFPRIFPMGIYSGFTEAASEPNTKDLESQ